MMCKDGCKKCRRYMTGGCCWCNDLRTPEQKQMVVIDTGETIDLTNFPNIKYPTDLGYCAGCKISLHAKTYYDSFIHIALDRPKIQKRAMNTVLDLLYDFHRLDKTQVIDRLSTLVGKCYLNPETTDWCNETIHVLYDSPEYTIEMRQYLYQQISGIKEENLFEN